MSTAVTESPAANSDPKAAKKVAKLSTNATKKKNKSKKATTSPIKAKAVKKVSTKHAKNSKVKVKKESPSVSGSVRNIT